MAYQVVSEGVVATSIPPPPSNNPNSPIVEWLKNNKINNDKLIKVLTDEELESVDDLLLFKTSLQDDKEFTKILVSKGIKIGVITKLIRALKTKNNNDNDNQNQNQSSSNIIMLDKNEKDAIQSLATKLFEIESKLKLLPDYDKKLSTSKRAISDEIDNICNKWIELINSKKKLLYKQIEDIEKKELNQSKLLNKKLNDELYLIKETKSKCQSLMSFASLNDIWTPKQSDVNTQQPKENILSLVTNCISKMDKSLQIPKINVFEKLILTQFDQQKIIKLLDDNININEEMKEDDNNDDDADDDTPVIAIPATPEPYIHDDVDADDKLIPVDDDDDDDDDDKTTDVDSDDDMSIRVCMDDSDDSANDDIDPYLLKDDMEW